MLEDINKEFVSYVNQKYILLKLVKDFNEKMNFSINELKMPNLEKYLSSRFAFSTNQAENMCKYCEKFIPKSISQHYRYCTAKKGFDIKNGIDPNLVETFQPETIIDNIQLTLPQSLETTPAVKERASRKTKK